MAAVQCSLLLVAVSAALVSGVPVFMWSPDRPLSDLPQVPAFERISHDTFHANYLTRLLGKKSNVLVAFLQDKLHVNDISKYADVYNEHSDGGAFKNIKGLLDEHFSLEIPHVLGSHLALNNLRGNFPGDVHDLSSASDLSDLGLEDEQNHLVIVHLSVNGAQNAEAAFSSNDKVIGEISRHLGKRSVKYTALYTAQSSEETQEQLESHHTRQLMEAPQDLSDEGAFFNVSYVNGLMYAYLSSVSVCVMPTSVSKTLSYCTNNFTITAANMQNARMTANLAADDTLHATLAIDLIKTNYSSEKFNLSFMVPFKYQIDRWLILEAELTVKNASGGDMVKDLVMVTHGYDTFVSILYSYHCTAMEWLPKNDTTDMMASIILGGFQVQPFQVAGSAFKLSQDCLGWFTTAIWMGLIPTGVALTILFFGMYMIMGLTTNDRFDDPRGKQLIIMCEE